MVPDISKDRKHDMDVVVIRFTFLAIKVFKIFQKPCYLNLYEFKTSLACNHV